MFLINVFVRIGYISIMELKNFCIVCKKIKLKYLLFDVFLKKDVFFYLRFCNDIRYVYL